MMVLFCDRKGLLMIACRIHEIVLIACNIPSWDNSDIFRVIKLICWLALFEEPKNLFPFLNTFLNHDVSQPAIAVI